MRESARRSFLPARAARRCCRFRYRREQQETPEEVAKRRGIHVTLHGDEEAAIEREKLVCSERRGEGRVECPDGMGWRAVAKKPAYARYYARGMLAG